MNPSRILPIIVVAAVPLALGAWWLSNRTPQDVAVQDERRATDEAADDPWLYIQKPIYPRGRVETVHTNDQFTFLLVRVADADRWVATPPGEFSPGDIVQFEVAPRSVKQDFKSKSLGRVFPSIVLVGNGGVKLIQSSGKSETQQAATHGGVNSQEQPSSP